MARSRSWYRLAALAVAIVFAVGAVGSSAGGQGPDARDALIARQQALIDEQQTLITTQEALLNDYRCMFDIDTQLVPGGCPDLARPISTPTPTATPTPASTATATPTATPTPASTATATPTPTATPASTATPTPTATPAPTPAPLPDPTIPAGTTEGQWEQLRQCNANGNYQYTNPNGINFGAYEFRQTSWDDLARRHYPHLVGINPSKAAPADQDRMAYALYAERAWAPWPACDPSLPPDDDTAGDSTDFPAIPAGTTQAQWEQLLNCESNGNYRAYNPAGPYLGAFQFLQSTWNAVAARNYPRLSGIDPRDAAPADQHRMAHALYKESGWRPWPSCTEAFR